MRIAFALMISVLLATGCGKPPSEATTPPVSESWNPPKDSTNIVILYSSVQGGEGYKFEVPRARIEKLPDWTPAANTIPLAPQQAAQLALAWYKSLHPNLPAASISLQRIFRYETKCAYLVFLVPPEGAGPFQEPKDSMRTAVVLLDGTVVDAVTDPDANRRLRSICELGQPVALANAGSSPDGEAGTIGPAWLRCNIKRVTTSYGPCRIV